MWISNYPGLPRILKISGILEIEKAQMQLRRGLDFEFFEIRYDRAKVRRYHSSTKFCRFTILHILACLVLISVLQYCSLSDSNFIEPTSQRAFEKRKKKKTAGLTPSGLELVKELRRSGGRVVRHPPCNGEPHRFESGPGLLCVLSQKPVKVIALVATSTHDS